MSTVREAPAREDRRANAGPPARRARERLGGYTDGVCRYREVVAVPGAHGSTLVIDRIAGTSSDPRLIAHLCADEPPENVPIVCALYLADESGRRCRPLTLEDFDRAPVDPEESMTGADASFPMRDAELRDGDGRTYRLELASSPGVPGLRWHRRACKDANDLEVITVREAIGSLESYEPVRTLTADAVAGHHDDPGVSVTSLRSELERVSTSPVVLNRRLRGAVLAAVADGRPSLSAIAIRCGRIKRKAKGTESGETSWLARRIGLLPEAGKSDPTPWVHSEVLALIARDGLGIAPREVELG